MTSYGPSRVPRVTATFCVAAPAAGSSINRSAERSSASSDSTSRRSSASPPQASRRKASRSAGARSSAAWNSSSTFDQSADMALAFGWPVPQRKFSISIRSALGGFRTV